jgi:hypothetical protein
MIPEAIAARDAFLAAKTQLVATFDRVPNDRKNWSPAPTARTPIEIVVHCAESIHNISEMIAGRPFHVPTTREADEIFRVNEAKISTPQRALALLETNTAAFLQVLESLTPTDLERPFVPPFGLGEVPLPISLGFPTDHTRWHIAQLEYLQTVYGDRDWGF